MADGERENRTLEELVGRAFAATSKPAELTREVPLALAATLARAGVQRVAVRALALAVRDVSDLEPLSPGDPLTPQQTQALAALLAEAALPPALGLVLEAARAHLARRAALQTLVALLLATWHLGEVPEGVARASRS